MTGLQSGNPSTLSAKLSTLPEVHKNRASVAFLNALRDVDAFFADVELREIQKLEEDNKEGPDVIKQTFESLWDP